MKRFFRKLPGFNAAGANSTGAKATSKRPSSKATFKPSFQALEDRKLMYGATISDGVLEVVGTNPGEFVQGRAVSGNDVITIDHNASDLFGGTGVVVRITDGRDGQFIAGGSFDFRAFNHLRVQALGGNDVVQNNLRNPSEVSRPFFQNPAADKTDALFGGNGHDQLFAGRNNSQLDGGAGSDVLFGGWGNDTYSFRGDNFGAFDQIMGEAENSGTDTLDFSTNSSGVKLDLGVAVQNVGNGHFVSLGGVATMENVYGSRFSDSITGNGRDNMLDGGLGNDTLVGKSGSDTYAFSSRDGNALGSDTIVERFGDFGTDTLDFSYYWEGVGIDLSATSRMLVASQLVLQLTDGQSIENVIGTRQRDVIFGNNLNNVLYGHGGDDQLWGGYGEDSLFGSDGNDQLGAFWRNGQWIDDSDRDWMYGEGGNDMVAGGSGNDTLVGGTGADDIWGDSGNDRLFAGNADKSGDGARDTLHGGGNDGDGDDRFYGMDWWLDWSDQTQAEKNRQAWEEYFGLG